MDFHGTFSRPARAYVLLRVAQAPFCAVALHAMYYNFLRIHQTLRVTPAMAAGVTDRVWEMGDLVEMLEAFEARRDIA
jgi:hypothetical protein